MLFYDDIKRFLHVLIFINILYVIIFIFISFNIYQHFIYYSDFIASRIENKEVKECVVGPDHIAFLLDVRYLHLFTVIVDV